MIITLLNRAYKICSDSGLFESEVPKIVDIFTRNGYPRKVIDKQISIFRKMLKKPKTDIRSQNDKENEKESVFLGVPFVGDVSKVFKRRVIKSFRKYYSKKKLNLYFSSGPKLISKISKGVKMKTYRPYDCVYKIPCKGCGTCFIGQTKRLRSLRVNEHKNYKDDASSAILHHKNNTGHDIDFENVSVLTYVPFLSKRLICESLYMRDYDIFDKNVGTELTLFD